MSVSLHKNQLGCNLHIARRLPASVIVAQNLVRRCLLADVLWALGSVGCQGDLSAALILLLGAPSHGDGANDAAALDDG
jgi:hypothetical protein